MLAVLAVAWLVVLVPPVLRARSHARSRGDSIGDFNRRLGVLGRTPSRASRRAARTPAHAGRETRALQPVMAPVQVPSLAARRNLRSAPAPARALPGPLVPVRTRAAERSARRRREVVIVCFTAAVLTAAIASALGGTFFWALQILADLCLLTYVFGMMWFRGNASDHLRAVRYLPQPQPARPAPAYALRRTASR